MIYLDCASASPLYKYKPKSNTWFNSNSQYQELNLENEVKNIYLGPKGEDYNIYYFASCSEANRSIKNLNKKTFTTTISHPSLYGERVIEVDSAGRIDLDCLYRLCYNNPGSVISVEAINSEMGCSNDLLSIRQITLEFDCILHLDINAGLMTRSYRKYDADILTFSTYKLGTPAGLGILLIKGFSNFVYNGLTKPYYMLDWFLQSYNSINCDKLLRMSKHWATLKDVCRPVWPYSYSHIFTAEFDTQGNLLYRYLLKNEIYCSRGYACNKGVGSPTYKKLGYNPKNMLRLSFNHLTKEKELIEGISKIKELAIKLRK